MARKTKKPLEAPQGRYFALPHNVLDSQAWIDCSPPAKALLMELCRQHTGINNGRLHLCNSWLSKRGWKRHATVRKLRDELIRARLILQTRHGGLNNGSHWFALTWLPITNYVDLGITSHDYHPGAYHLPPLPESDKEKKPRTPYVGAKGSTKTPCVSGDTATRTACVSEKPTSGYEAETPYVHNEYIPIPTASNIVEVIV